MYERRWDNFDLAGLTFIDPSFDPSEQGPQSGEDLYNTSTLETDLSFSLSGSDIEDISASISVIKGAVNSNGSGLQQLAGYEGLGKGAGAGGTYMIFELRSTGNSAAEAVAVTASEYRVVP